MGWEVIENVKPSGKPDAVPPAGVRVASRGCLGGKRYIALIVGRDLARSMGMAVEHYPVRLMFGSGSDAGKIAVALGPDNDRSGGFRAKLQKSGNYLITISQASAEGLLSVNFPELRETRCEVIRPENGGPRMFIFRASKEMLEVSDD